MLDPGMHLSQPLWLWGLVAIPLVLIWLWRSAPVRLSGREDQYADPHLLPHLSGTAMAGKHLNKRPLIGWMIAWSLLLLAMAGPRLGFHNINPFEPGADLVILLDISASMKSKDVQPSRLDRARQEIQDLIRSKQGLRIGMVAFATIAHVVTPITEDGDSLLQQLPALSPDLVRLQGSRLSAALERASQLIAEQPSNVSHNLLLISDGDFSEPEIDQQVQTLYQNGTRLHVLGVGTSEGARVPHVTNNNGVAVVSRLDAQGLRQLASSGGGIFRIASYRDKDTGDILDAILSQASAITNKNIQTRVWKEYYYWLLGPAMLILLLLFHPAVNLSRTAPRGGV